MAIRFECTACGRCCHGSRLPLSLSDAIQWLESGGRVDILCDASPLDGLPDPLTSLRLQRTFPARSGNLEIAVNLVLTASFDGACPHLLPDVGCGSYDHPPATSRVYSAELNPDRMIDPAARGCPDEAWSDMMPVLADDTGTVIEPGTTSTIVAAHCSHRDEAAAREFIASRLGIAVTALRNEGYAVWTPAPDALLAALHAALEADSEDDWPDWSWSFVSNRSATRSLIRSTGAEVVLPGAMPGFSYLPFSEAVADAPHCGPDNLEELPA
jgi:Fe-S-cluster containining protein